MIPDPLTSSNRAGVIPFSVLCFLLFPTACFANSSWHWVTFAPYTLLPLAIALTLGIETWGIFRFAGVTARRRAIIIVGMANSFSFIAPYFVSFFLSPPWKVLYYYPSYMVTLFSLVLTLIVELPVVYFGLRKTVPDHNRKRLFWIASWLNLLTTLLVGIIERIACRGEW